ncbi:MAG: PIN domain-containing protein [Deltaproteobacteria bacterium]|nr:PIN domain-containing protein [Deltaproteobacteria bacterium]
MIFVTDTHGLVYHLTGQRKRLGRRARVIFERTERGQDAVLIPFTALEEVMLLSEAGKIHLRIPFRELLMSLMQADNFDLGENNADLLLEASALTGIRDPFDRMIVAQARLSEATLITTDEEIRESGLVKTVWD